MTWKILKFYAFDDIKKFQWLIDGAKKLQTQWRREKYDAKIRIEKNMQKKNWRASLLKKRKEADAKRKKVRCPAQMVHVKKTSDNLFITSVFFCLLCLVMKNYILWNAYIVPVLYWTMLILTILHISRLCTGEDLTGSIPASENAVTPQLYRTVNIFTNF